MFSFILLFWFFPSVGGVIIVVGNAVVVYPSYVEFIWHEFVMLLTNPSFAKLKKFPQGHKLSQSNKNNLIYYFYFNQSFLIKSITV